MNTKPIGIKLEVKVGIKDFDKLSVEEQYQTLCDLEEEIATLVDSNPNMVFLNGCGCYIYGVETEDGYVTEVEQLKIRY